VRAKQGAGYFDWLLQQSGVDIVLANRVTMAPQLGAAHFRWVPYGDAPLFPLTTARRKRRARIAARSTARKNGCSRHI
jgi:hypothetical protein